jgi:Sec-independent protein translocase protein TatA
MFEIEWGKLLVIGAVTAIVMAPKYCDVIDGWMTAIRRSRNR